MPNSRHLTGEAIDHARGSVDLAALRSFYGKGAKIIDEGDHWHVQRPGLNVPYFGKRGTTGLKR